MRYSLSCALIALAAAAHTPMLCAAESISLTIQADQPGKAISPDLFGIFFEDLSYAADGGLYAELVQNGSFEYSPADNNRGAKEKWNGLSTWEVVRRGGGTGSLMIDTTSPLHAANPHYAVLTVEQPGTGVGLANAGFDGITLQAGARYDVSLFARQLNGTAGSLTVNLETPAGQVLASATLAAPGVAWGKITATLTSTADATDARLVVLANDTGAIALDMGSLFPQATFKHHPNGLRPDLAQAIADLHPKFVRFPGGCVAHGDGVANIYHWKDSIGPLETRTSIPNIWRYRQSRGLGYFEYFQFCEDIGAKPLPVLAAGVSCQNSNYARGTGQEAIPLADMPAYVQDTLDLIEYANGPVTLTWGAKRAAAGHPQPFGLQYLGIGNEDKITPEFRERFQMLNAAVKAKHPEISVIGTAGPLPAGEDFQLGWRFAREQHADLIDEHYYRDAQWFLENLARYDGYDRASTKVYVGEYAVRSGKFQSSPLRSSLAEAAYLTSLERNGDVVQLASYAPLLAKIGHVSWAPNLIFFSNTAVYPGTSYYVQQAFCRNSGDRYLAYSVAGPDRQPDGKQPRLAHSVVRDSASGDLCIKLVNLTDAEQPVQVVLNGLGSSARSAALTVLTAADPLAMNEPGKPAAVQPQSDTLTIGPTFSYPAPAFSLTVIRIPGH